MSPGSDTVLREGWFEAMLRETGFLRRYPHYAGVLARVEPLATTNVPYMAVGLRRWDDPKSVLLMVNLDFVRREPQHVAGVLLHELHHIVLGHLSDIRFHAVADGRAMEVAMELSANENIREPAPESGLEVENFERFGIAPGQSTMERYVLLREAVDRGELQIGRLAGATWDSHRPRQAGGRAIGPGDLIDAGTDRARAKNWHGPGGDLGLPSGADEIERMRELIAEHLGGERGGADSLQSGTQRRLAKELTRVVTERFGRPVLDWPRILREAFPTQRRVHPDYKRPNRRFPERVGELPGRTRRPPRPHLVAVIDTSGSMDVDVLERVLREVRQLARIARVTVVESDAAVHRVRPVGAPVAALIGGGDTDFAPAIDEALRVADCEGIVYFTDGRGNMPVEPPAVPLLWILTHDQPVIVEPGSVVRLPMDR